MPNNNAESKARQRERNGNGTRAGSSGATNIARRIERKTFAEIEDDLVHGTDMICSVSGLTTYANGSCGIQLIVGPEYAMDAMQLIQDSRLKFTMVRAYHVPMPTVLPPKDEGAESDHE